MPKIKTLTAKCFRGIREATLPFEKQSVVLLGENGSGKSSFVDALDFFFRGRISHLEEAQTISTSRHAPHIHFNRDDAAVEIEFDQPPGMTSRTFGGLSPLPDELQKYVELGARSTFILRRKNLLDFIMAQPAPRYQQLAAIIGVDDLDRVDRALMHARGDLLAEKQSLDQRVQEAEMNLNELLEEEMITEEQILAALNKKLAALQQPPIESFDEVLASSRRLISDFELDRCPVCLQAIDRETLLASLAERIKDAEQIAQKASEIKVLQAALIDQVRAQLARSKKLISQLVELELPPETQILDRYVAHMKGLLSALEPDPVEMRLASMETYSQASEVKGFVDYLGSLLPRLRSEKERLEPTEGDG
jgi:DNA repair exonuclease SbcCD ATPase subunit